MSEFNKNKKHKSLEYSKTLTSNAKSTQLEFNNLLHNANEIEDFDKKQIYKTFNTVVNATPNLWEYFFKQVSLLPQKVYKICHLFIFKTVIFLSQLTSWFIITMLDDSEFIKTNDIQRLWEYLHYMPKDTVKFVLNNSIYKKYKIDKYIDNYVYFIFLVRNEPKSERNKISKDTKKILKKCRHIKKYNLDKLWNVFKNIDYADELKTSNTNIINYYKDIKSSKNHNFNHLYNLTIKNKIWDDKKIQNDIFELVDQYKKSSTKSKHTSSKNHEHSETHTNESHTQSKTSEHLENNKRSENPREVEGKPKDLSDTHSPLDAHDSSDAHDLTESDVHEHSESRVHSETKSNTTHNK